MCGLRRKKVLALVMLVVVLVAAMAVTASAEPYKSFGEFANDMGNSYALAASAAGATYSWSRTVVREPAPVAVVRAAWVGAGTYLFHQNFVVAPRVQETIVNRFTR